MFTYWDGFEIDGSDTDFDVVLPENVQIWEFVECFLSVPIFSDTPKPFISCEQPGNREPRKLKLAQLKEMLLTGNYPEISVKVLCRHPEQLSDELREKVYAISERREPHEPAYGKSENPCTTPVIQTYYDRGGATVELRIQQSGTGHELSCEDVNYGYAYNVEWFLSTEQEHSCFRINVGPGFFYEYAIFIIDYLRDHFPSIGTCGGLDCGGGWTGGCTYANSLYYLERILLPIKYNVRNTLKRLTEYDIVRSWSHQYFSKKGLKHVFADGFCLAGYPWWEKPSGDNKPLSFAKYVELVDLALEVDDTPFATVCETAIRIMLPQPGEYAQNPAALEKLKEALPDRSLDRSEATGYFAFTKIDGIPMIEFRVPYFMKKYLLTLLELSESGVIDFIKPVIYQKRHENDK